MNQLNDSPAWVARNPQRLEELREQRPGLCRLKTVIELTGLGKTTVYRLMKAGEFPASVKIGANSTAWRVAEVLAWVDELGAA